MIERLPSLTLVRLILALLLATIGIHACEPVRGLQQRHGSAFSAATYQVAVKPHRRVEVANLLVAPFPPQPAAPVTEAGTPAPVFEHPLLRPNSTGPPRDAILSRQPAPRAPPLI